MFQKPTPIDGPTPTLTAAKVGQIVNYRLTDRDVSQANERYAAASAHAQRHNEQDGKQVHFGNRHKAGAIHPMIIVRDWGSNMVNGQVFLDGNDTLWVTSVHKGAEAGQWEI